MQTEGKVRGKYKDPLMSHPAIMAYRARFSYCPNPGTRRDMAVTVNDLDLWESVLDNWCYRDLKGKLRKKNPLDVKGMLNEYEARCHAAAPVRDTRQVDTFKEGRRESVWWWQRDRVLS